MSWISPLSWQSPSWLWLLLALAIPLLIHLMRRSQPRVITFAAAQWLLAKRQRRLNRQFLRNKVLLLLRLLMIAVLSLLLAQPLLQRNATESDTLLLVDPRIESAVLDAFLQQHPELTRVLWLDSEPVPIADPRPHTEEVWNSLSALADKKQFRRARLLIQDSQNPSSHTALRVSPHWQWHTVNDGVTGKRPVTRLALIGDAPVWLNAVLEQLRNDLDTELNVQTFDRASEISATEFDWLIFSGADAIPESVQAFTKAGGLLISDQQLTPHKELEFTALSSLPAAQVAAMGRGGWLRYIGDWNQLAFYRDRMLPQQLWQQWRGQDWPLQFHSRGQWSPTNHPGIPVADVDVVETFEHPLDDYLLLLLAILLLAERSLALSSMNRGGTAHAR